MKSIENILKTQSDYIQQEITTFASKDDDGILQFEFPQLIQYVAETILLSIWVNMISSFLYDWAKEIILSKKQLKENREKLVNSIKEGNNKPNISYLDTPECKKMVENTLKGAGISQKRSHVISSLIIDNIKKSTPHEIKG